MFETMHGRFWSPPPPWGRSTEKFRSGTRQIEYWIDLSYTAYDLADLADSLNDEGVPEKEIGMVKAFLDKTKESDSEFFTILNREIHGWQDRITHLSTSDFVRFVPFGMHLAAGLESLLPYFQALDKLSSNRNTKERSRRAAGRPSGAAS